MSKPPVVYSDSAKNLKIGTYRHYKNHLYEVLGVAHHSETMEELVVYRNAAGNLWVRPLAMFLETVEIDGKSIPRFAYSGE